MDELMKNEITEVKETPDELLEQQAQEIVECYGKLKAAKENGNEEQANYYKDQLETLLNGEEQDVAGVSCGTFCQKTRTDSSLGYNPAYTSVN